MRKFPQASQRVFKHLLFCAITCMLSAIQMAHALDVNAYTDYEGPLGETSKVYMTLYLFDDGQIKGHYYHSDDENKNRLKGGVIDNQISLEEVDKNGATVSTFDGELSINGRYQGVQISSSAKKYSDFILVRNSTVWADWGHRYSSLGITSDETVERFAQKVKTAFVELDYGWLADQISYPIDVNVHGERKTIQDKPTFLTIAPTAFTRQFRGRLASYPATDMFANYMGAMIGQGDVWMSCYSKNEKSPAKLRIIGINN